MIPAKLSTKFDTCVGKVSGLNSPVKDKPSHHLKPFKAASDHPVLNVKYIPVPRRRKLTQEVSLNGLKLQ